MRTPKTIDTTGVLEGARAAEGRHRARAGVVTAVCEPQRAEVRLLHLGHCTMAQVRGAGDAWRAACDAAGVPRNRFNESRRALVSKGLVRSEGLYVLAE